VVVHDRLALEHERRAAGDDAVAPLAVLTGGERI
jgi:hypothetical protein